MDYLDGEVRSKDEVVARCMEHLNRDSAKKFAIFNTSNLITLYKMHLLPVISRSQQIFATAVTDQK